MLYTGTTGLTLGSIIYVYVVPVAEWLRCWTWDIKVPGSIPAAASFFFTPFGQGINTDVPLSTQE